LSVSESNLPWLFPRRGKAVSKCGSNLSLLYSAEVKNAQSFTVRFGVQAYKHDFVQQTFM